MTKKISVFFINLCMRIVCSKASQKMLNKAFGINPQHFTMGFVKEVA